jgi:hypothetical protein
LGQALAVFQAFSLAKPRILRLLSQKLKFWESPGFKKFTAKARKGRGGLYFVLAGRSSPWRAAVRWRAVFALAGRFCLYVPSWSKFLFAPVLYIR